MGQLRGGVALVQRLPKARLTRAWSFAAGVFLDEAAIHHARDESHGVQMPRQRRWRSSNPENQGLVAELIDARVEKPEGNLEHFYEKPSGDD